MKWTLLIVLTISACALQQKNQQMITQNSWELTSIKGTKLDLQANQKRPSITIDSTDKKVTGFAGCNRYFGSLHVLTETEIEFGPMGATKMMCPFMETETSYFKLLGEARFYVFNTTVSKLTLLDENKKELALFEAGQ